MALSWWAISELASLAFHFLQTLPQLGLCHFFLISEICAFNSSLLPSSSSPLPPCEEMALTPTSAQVCSVSILVDSRSDSGFVVCGRSQNHARFGAVEVADLSELKVLGPLGRGASGFVQKAMHLPSKKILALKVVPVDLTEKKAQQVITELRTLHQSVSPYIVGFYGAFYKVWLSRSFLPLLVRTLAERKYRRRQSVWCWST